MEYDPINDDLLEQVARYNARPEPISEFAAWVKPTGQADYTHNTITAKAWQIGPFIVHRQLSSVDGLPTGKGWQISHVCGMLIQDGFDTKAQAIRAAQTYNREVGHVVTSSDYNEAARQTTPQSQRRAVNAKKEIKERV